MYTTDEYGFLVDPEDWTQQFAESCAESENITLTEKHWRIINTIRDIYSETSVVPELRILMKTLNSEDTTEKATRKSVYQLFPYGYGQQACKIAGMRLPRKLWLDA